MHGQGTTGYNYWSRPITERISQTALTSTQPRNFQAEKLHPLSTEMPSNRCETARMIAPICRIIFLLRR